MSDFPNGHLTTGNKPVITDVYKEAEEYLKEQKRQDNLYNDEGDIYESAVIYAFIAGAKWQKKMLSDKACEWLSEHLYDKEYEIRDNEGTWVDTDELVDGLRRYMEGE